IWVILFIVVNYFFSNWKIKYDIARAEKETQVTAALSDSVTNHPTVQSFAGAAFESKRFGKVNKALRKATRLQWNIDAVVEAVQALLFIGIEFALFYFAIKGWQNGTVSIGTFVLIQSYLIQLIMQMWDLGRVIRTVYESFADAKEMVEILETPYEIQDGDDAKKLQVDKGGIVVDSVGFSFNKTRKVLKGINITIQPGEKVALIGPSGAGKSTLVKLLMRLYDIQEGEILIDNQPIHKVTQKSLRDSISLVPQDTILFHRPIAENIRYGKRNATDEEVKRAAKLAHCEEFIKNFPEGYKTYVGERGVKLSGGERQRVAIARAILKDAPVLILDEATSSLDSHSEMLIQDALEKLMKGKTTIVIAHRLSTIQKMDRIIVIDNGGVVEEGSHEELLAKKTSVYKKLWDVQAGGFLKDA
ncbi:MAG: ABC transporter ATP-binding protein, partial [Candidatus Jacksonbacteria bacterium]|nr:ABC transporter ATP-binding protein [Candidatus Jacksonbacteria bacterium]